MLPKIYLCAKQNYKENNNQSINQITKQNKYIFCKEETKQTPEFI